MTAPTREQVYPDQETQTARRALAPTGLTLMSAAESYRLACDARGLSSATQEIYNDVIRELSDFLTSKGMPTDPGLVKREHVEAYLVSLKDVGKAPASVALCYRSLKTFWSWLVDEDEIAVSPMLKMKPPKVPFTPPRLVDEDAFRKLLKAAEGRDFESRRDLALIRLLASTGMRRGECVALTMDDLDLPSRAVVIRAGTSKSRRQRVARFGAKTAAALDRYLRLRRARPDADLPNLWLGRQRGGLRPNGLLQAIRRRGKKAGLARLYTHQFRHGFANAYLRNGGAEGDLMQLAGWESREMMDRYGAIARAERAQANYVDPWDEI
jgi:site-specific recombinase XerD